MKKLLLLFAVLASGAGYSQFVWNPKADFTGDRYEGVCFAINDTVYYGLGFNGSSSTADNSFYAFDPVGNVWSTITAFPGTPRRLASAFSIGGKGYVGFGVDPVTTLELHDLWEYDPATGNWHARASLPVSYGWMSGTAAVTNSKAYCGLGLHDHTSGMLNLTWWEYDPIADNWLQKLDMPGVGLYQTSSLAVGDSIYVLCGIGTNLLVPTNEVWLYDALANTWTPLAGFPGSSRFYASAFTLNGVGYAGYGNSGSSDIADFYSLNTATGTWTPQVNLGARMFDGACATNSAGYVVNSVGTTTKKVWEFAPITLDVSEQSSQNDVSVFPNPAENYFTISTKEKIKIISITDVTGKKISNTKLTDNRVDCTEMSKGVYFVRVETKSGISNLKIILSR